ncbi:DUF1842 domain-containing protein [Tenacibaculum sp. SG-28]|uniref:DUF1842 domain-containing protein n=1 Tax=Tenacibaculum sp. SG-28 TaxID=754426 RepID=UPI000CF37478|nr:DUF1842 domain-containing protein [Tenacibaculum sp. SG-28]PQJ23394.1 hypothetical protein BSU00_04175 [Tenacibaculum sp. SG-28]
MFTPKEKVIPKTKRDIYYVKCTVGNTAVPKATIAKFSLAISKKNNKISGIVKISNIYSNDTATINVVGKIQERGTKFITKQLKLIGESIVHENAELEKNTMERFTASLTLDATGNGIGNFSFKKIKETNIPVLPLITKQEECSKKEHFTVAS